MNIRKDAASKFSWSQLDELADACVPQVLAAMKALRDQLAKEGPENFRYVLNHGRHEMRVRIEAPVVVPDNLTPRQADRLLCNSLPLTVVNGQLIQAVHSGQRITLGKLDVSRSFVCLHGGRLELVYLIGPIKPARR